MRLLTTLLILTTLYTKGQSHSDYELYSIVLDSYIDNLSRGKGSIKQVIIIANYKPERNYAEPYGKDFFSDSDEFKYSRLHYDTALIRLVKDEAIKKGLIQLESNFLTTQIFEASKFSLEIPVTTIKYKRYKRFFKSLFRRNIKKGWEKFYKKYPTALGAYKLSKVIYSGEYALFYVGHQAGGLFGSGDIFILKQENNNWRIINSLNVWQS